MLLLFKLLRKYLVQPLRHDCASWVKNAKNKSGFLHRLGTGLQGLTYCSLGITVSNRKMFCIFCKMQYNSNKDLFVIDIFVIPVW
jgi:hypothetical protein